MQNNTILINDTLISYATVGRGEKPLVFLHGWRSSKEAWTPVAELMEGADFRMFFVDLPGFGASETPRRPYTLHDYAETVRVFIEKFSLNDCILVGHSFGARVAIKLASEHPKLLQKLILVGSGGSRPWWRHIGMFIAKLTRPFFTPRFMASLRARLYRAIGADDYLATPTLKQTFLNAINENLMPLCSFIQCATLVIWGENDAEASLKYGRRMARAIPNTRLEIIEGAGHYCFRDKPQKFSTLLIPFLNDND